MDPDQFGGRTDDDLFSDDYEPVAPEQQQVSVPVPATSQPEDAPASIPTPEASPVPSAPPQAPKSLAQSRHNHNRPDKPPRGPSSHNNNNNNNKHTKPNTADTPPQPTIPPPSTSPPPPTAPKEPAAARGENILGRNTASVNSESRIGSGVNPRKKPTEEELAAKMEKMRILAAEKTRKFEQAQRDENEHAAAYAKGMEEARKRKAEEAARRKAADEDRRRLEDERAKNRERKLAAMGMKEGGWDEGKEERLQEEERKVFRGANGGIRGVRAGGGLAASRYARDEDGDGGERFGGGERERGGNRGRGGRGRGGRGGGRGGRALFDADGEDRDRDRNCGGSGSGYSHARDDRKKEVKPSLAPDEFPALPGAASVPAKIDTKPVVGSYANTVLFSPLSPLGQWDDEVAAMDEKNKEGKL